MTSLRLADRRRIEVAGAGEVLDALGERLAAGVSAGVAAARGLASADVDWHAARSEIIGSERSIILAEEPDGPVLAAKYLAPASSTEIHDHGSAGAVIVVEGRDRYESFERTGPATVQSESVHDLAVGDVTWWNEPPDDVHRQRGLADGAIELVLLASPPAGPTSFTDTTPDASELRAAVIDGFLAGDASRLAPWYHDDVFVDGNVPDCRFQLRGRQAVLDTLEHEEFAKPDRRLSFLRATDTTDGLLLETELRYTEAGELHVCREAHHLRVRAGLVVEHVLWCTGIADAASAYNLFETAPLERA